MALQMVKWSEVSPIPSIWAHPCSIEAIFSPRSSGIGLFHVLCMHIPPVVKWRNYFLSEGTFKKPFRIILGSAKMNPWLPKHKGKFWPCKKKKSFWSWIVDKRVLKGILKLLSCCCPWNSVTSIGSLVNWATPVQRNPLGHWAKALKMQVASSAGGEHDCCFLHLNLEVLVH